MKRPWLLAMLTLLLAGCSAVWIQEVMPLEPGAPNQGAAVAPALPPVTPRLVPYENASLGVKLEIPAGAIPVEQQDQLTVTFGETELHAIRVVRTEVQPLGQLTAEFAAANIKASMGRFFVEEQKVRRLAGREAGYVKAHFDSAAGRWDREFYLLPVGLVEYRISCGTVDGPPPVPWEKVRPLCERMLESVELAEGE